MVLYLDSAILCGLIMNCLCISTAAEALKINLRIHWLVTWGLIMSCITVAAFVLPYLRPLVILVYPFVIRYIFGKCHIWELIRRCLYSLSSTLIYGGMLLAVIPPEKLSLISYGAGTYYLAEDLYFYLPLLALKLATSFIFKVLCRPKKLFPVTISCSGETVTANAFMDTGNSLSDPVTHRPVIVIDPDLFEGLPNDFARAISIRTVGNDMTKAYIYPVDRLYFQDEHKEYSDIYAIVSPKPLNKEGQYKVLLQNSL